MKESALESVDTAAIAEEAAATISAAHVGRKINKHLVGIYVTIHRPTCRPQMKDAKIETTGDEGQRVDIEKDKTTKPCFKTDIHPLWKELDKTARVAEKVLAKYSVSDTIKGEYLVNVFKLPELLKELEQVRTDRLAVATKMQGVREDEIMPQLYQEYPDNFEQVRGSIPESFRATCGMEFVVRPLTVASVEDFDLSALAPDEANRIVAANQEMIQERFKNQFQQVLDGVFKEAASICDEIASAEYFGRKNQKSINNLLQTLEKVRNFSDLADDPTVVSKLQVAIEAVKTHSVDDINNSEVAQDQIQKAFEPLRQSLKEITQVNIEVGAGKSERDIG